MNDLPPPPSRLLKIVAFFARWSLRLMLAIALALALAWAALHGLIVPRIGEFRPLLEARLEKALGVPARVGTISAHSEWLIPSVELGDVVLLDAQGREALALPRVVVAVSPRSLLRLGFEQIYIDRPQLDVRRTADGQIWLAGLSIAAGPTDTRAADWLFSQPEVVVRGGTLRWSDELRAAPTLALGEVDVLLRNRPWRHSLRVDATPPAQWGERLSLRGQLRAPLLSTRAGHWQQWSGQLFAELPRVNVAQLQNYVDFGPDTAVTSGEGTVRAWVDVQRGAVAGATADLALSQVNATLGARLQPLALQSLHGRLGLRLLDGGFEFSTQGLQFLTDDGLRWPGGNVSVRHTAPPAAGRQQGEISADRLDLAALAEIASRLPLDDAAHEALRAYAPQGLVETLQASWRGPLEAPTQYQARGRLKDLSLAGSPQPESTAVVGLRGAALNFDLNQAGGRADLSISDGALVVPGAFEAPEIPLTRLSAALRWQIEGEGAGQHIAVQANNVRLANQDLEGEAQATWETERPGPSGTPARFPGVIDLRGTLSRADGKQVHRYLPLSIPADSRRYVRDAVVAGQATGVQFRVKGRLNDVPASTPEEGEFHIAAKIADATLAYVPTRLQPAGDRPWPALTKLSGELVFDRSSMQVRKASGQFAGTPALRLSKVEATIPDLSHTVVSVDAQARGPLAEMLNLIGNSPLARMTGNALDRARGSGNADLQLRLSLPVNDINQSKVQGRVTLAGNDLAIAPTVPALSRARGAVQFSETGFTLEGVQARALGGDMRLEGGMRPPPAGSGESAIQVRAQGTASAEGLQQATQLGIVAQLARSAKGTAPYTLALKFHRGEPELRVSSSLQGMALALPAPLGKAAESSLPIQYETQIARTTPGAGNAGKPPPLQERMTLDLGSVGAITYLRDTSGPQAHVVSGAIGLGAGFRDAPALPAKGVAANIQLPQLDLDAWEAVLNQATPSEPSAEPGSGRSQDYLPTTMAVRAKELTLQGRTLHDVVAGGTRDGATWQVNLDAKELDGYIEYRQAGPREGASSRLYARLSRMTLPQSAATQVEALLDEQPAHLPALDIVVNNFELSKRSLGRVEIQAENRVGEAGLREWRLGKFNMSTPEAALTANGNWALVRATAGSAARGQPQRRTALNFKLDIKDSGELLARFGMPGVVRQGKGRMEGQVGWMGTPFSPDFPSMGGQVNLNVEAGQFLKADPGLAKLLGVLSLQSLPRRLTLDFRDVFSEGFAFDFVRGDMRIDKGVATTNNLQMKGVNAAVLMEGKADLARETQDLRVVVVPEINAMTASLVATAINPVVGLGSFLAQMFLRGPVIEAATQEFHIDGTWTDPQVTRTERRSRSAGAAPGSPPNTDRPPPGAAAPRTGEAP